MSSTGRRADKPSESMHLTPPADVEPKRHESVDQVVTGRDCIEHRADGLHFLLAFGQGCHDPGHVRDTRLLVR